MYFITCIQKYEKKDNLNIDIGAYNTCGHLCKYCYANANKKLVIDNMKKHDENSPFLIGNLQLGDTIKEAKQKSWIVNEDIQMRFTLK